MHIKKTLISALFLLSLSLNISAHPHMAIYTSCEFNFEGDQPVGMWFNYSFDQYFSISLLSDFDLDGDKIFNPEETEKIYNSAFIYLSNYGYLISIRDKDGRTSPEEVSDFSVSVDNDIITYRFYIDLENRAEREFFVSVYDKTFYCAIYYTEDNPVKVRSDPGIETQYTIEENTDYPIYYNPYALPTETGTYDKWEPGLQTFFPKEIHFVY